MTFKKMGIILITVCVLGTSIPTRAQEMPPDEMRRAMETSSGVYIIGLADGKSAQDIVLQDGDVITDEVSIGDEETVILEIAGDIETILQKVDIYEMDPAVEYIQEDIEYDLIDFEVLDPPANTTMYMLEENGAVNPVNDAMYSDQYYLTNDMRIREAWEILDGENPGRVKVAVIDTGVNMEHEDLQANLNKSLSYDLQNNSPQFGDLNGHGTHVAGIIGATAGNEIGIAGVAKNYAEIICYNSFYWNNETNKPSTKSSVLLRAYEKAIADDVRVVNMSLGGYHNGTSTYDKALREALDEANRKGVVTVCAGGNGNQSSFLFPSDIDSVISVVATDKDNEKCGFSDFNQYKDIAASGNQIKSTYCDRGQDQEYNKSAYKEMNGTSQAAPMVSSIIAMMISVNPALSSEQIKDIIYKTATDLGDEGRDVKYGYGLINAQDCVQNAIDLKSVVGRADVRVDDQNLGNAMFDLIVSNVQSTNEIQEVRTEVYTKPDKSDRYTYVLKKQEDGSYKATINYINHEKNEGKYYCDTVMCDAQKNVFTLQTQYVNVTKPVYRIVNAPSQNGTLEMVQQAKEGNTVNINVRADIGYGLSKIEVDGFAIEGTSFVMPEKDVVVKGIFIPVNRWYLNNGKWYYYEGGQAVTGWKKAGKYWYYLNPGGDMATGWKKAGKYWYYLNPDGDMATGWKKVGKYWYYLNPNGDMATGWEKVGKYWYYLNPNGDMAMGWKKIGSSWYYFYSSGIMAENCWIGKNFVNGQGRWVA